MNQTVKKVLIGIAVAFVAFIAIDAIASIVSEVSSTQQTPASNQSAMSSASSAVSSSESASSQQSAESSSAAQQQQLEELARMEAEYRDTVENKDMWADGIVVEALDKLAASGAIAPLPEDFELFSHVFNFRQEGSGYVIDFLDGDAQARLTGDFNLDLSDGAKVAICREDHRVDTQTGARVRDLGVLSTDKDGAFTINHLNSDSGSVLLATPTLKPSGYFDMIDKNVPQSVYANTLDECRYLIVYGGCYSNIIENYYALGPNSKGITDRIDVTTVVLVVDTQTREVLHIQIIGTDIPGASVDVARSENYGKCLTEEANAYISQLLLAG